MRRLLVALLCSCQPDTTGNTPPLPTSGESSSSGTPTSSGGDADTAVPPASTSTSSTTSTTTSSSTGEVSTTPGGDELGPMPDLPIECPPPCDARDPRACPRGKTCWEQPNHPPMCMEPCFNESDGNNCRFQCVGDGGGVNYFCTPCDFDKPQH